MKENDVESKPQEEILTASYHGEKCRHNGENPDYELACDECPYYLACFPDWQYLAEKYGCSDEKSINSIKTSSDDDLEAFLRADAEKDNISDEEIEIDLQVMEELAKRQEARGDSPDNLSAIIGYFMHEGQTDKTEKLMTDKRNESCIDKNPWTVLYSQTEGCLLKDGFYHHGRESEKLP